MGCITQLNRLGDLGNKLGDLQPKINPNYPKHVFGAAKRHQNSILPSLAYLGWQITLFVAQITQSIQLGDTPLITQSNPSHLDIPIP